MYDRRCESCGIVLEDCLEPTPKSAPIPCACGGEFVRTQATGKFHKASGIIPDGIPGGVVIRNGICYPDGTPRRFDSHSEMRRAARELGVHSQVRHMPNDPGSDKNPHTTRWVSPPVISEAERVAHIRASWKAEGIDLDHLPSRVDSLPNATPRDRVEEIIATQVRDHITPEGLPYGRSEFARSPEFSRR